MKTNVIFLGWLLFLQLLLVQNTYSSITRTRTMGDVGMIIKDGATYWLFPAAIAYNPNQVVFEWGGRPELLFHSSLNYGFDRWAGGIVSFGKSNPKSLGVFWSEASEADPFSVFSAGGISVTQKYDLFCAIKTEVNSVGLHLSRSSGRNESLRNPGMNSKTSISQTRFDLGISRLNFDLDFGYQFAAFNTSGNKIEGHSFNFTIRGFKSVSETFILIPLLDFAISFENNENASGRYWKIWTGAGLGYQVDKGDLLALGVTILRTSQSLETENTGTKSGMTVLDLPLAFGGIETGLFSWLKLRIGFQKALRRIAQKNESGYSTQESIKIQAPFAATAGIGLQYKRLTLDLSWDSNFLKRGPYFLSGSKGDIFNLVSLTYQF